MKKFIRYPSLRLELMDSIEALSSKEIQENEWVKGIPDNNGNISLLDYTIHFLFDDTNLATDPNLSLGSFLYDQDEVIAMQKIIQKFDEIFEKYGVKIDTKYLIESPEWSELMTCANDAKKILLSINNIEHFSV